MNQAQAKPKGSGRRVAWSLLFLLIACLSVWTVATQVKGFSPRLFWEYIKDSKPGWLAAAFVSMLAYILFDALMVHCLLKGFGHARSLTNCVTYAASDLYFSAITPSATGGQPMEAYYMVKDGVPAIISTVVMLTYLLLYTLSIVIIELVCLIFGPFTFLSYSVLSRVLIAAGAAIQLGLTVLYGMLLWNEGMLRKILHWGLKLLARLRIVRNHDKRRQKLDVTMDEYAEATKLLRGHRTLLWKTLLLNLAHRASQILVTAFCFLAGGGALSQAPKLFAMQANVVIGASCVPIPGAMGVSDFLMLDGFSSLMSAQQAANLELLARSTSFYICVLLSGIIVLVKSAILRFRKK